MVTGCQLSLVLVGDFGEKGSGVDDSVFQLRFSGPAHIAAKSHYTAVFSYDFLQPVYCFGLRYGLHAVVEKKYFAVVLHTRYRFGGHLSCVTPGIERIDVPRQLYSCKQVQRHVACGHALEIVESGISVKRLCEKSCLWAQRCVGESIAGFVKTYAGVEQSEFGSLRYEVGGHVGAGCHERQILQVLADEYSEYVAVAFERA